MLNKISSAYKTQFKICDSITTDSGIVIPCISGQVGQVGVVSQNGYRYKEDFWNKILADQNTMKIIDDRRMLGTIEHPTDDGEFMATSYENASHVVMKAWVQNNQPFATFGLLNNPKGNAIKALVDVGCHPGVSTRGLGSFGQDGISQFVEDANYCLLTWDIVKNPNFSDLSMAPVTDSLMASPIFKELVEMHGLKDSADDHYSKDALRAEMVAAIDEILKKHNLR